MTTGLLMRRSLTAVVVAVIGLGLTTLPAAADVAGSSHSRDVRTPGLDKCGPAPAPVATAVSAHPLRDWRQCVRAAQKAQKANDRCVIAQKRADRAAKRAAALAGKHGPKPVKAAKRAAVTAKRAKKLCALVVPVVPQPGKPPTTPVQGFVPLAPAAPPVTPALPVAPPVVVAPVAPSVAAPIVPAPGSASNSATTSGARASGAASAARAPRALGELRATGRDTRLPFSISSRDSRIPAALAPVVAPKANFPLLLMILLLVGFLFVQRWIDRGDPKLAIASAPDRDLVFE